MTSWKDSFAAVDWGSTAGRAYALDASGRTLREAEGDAGTLMIPKQRFADAVYDLQRQLGPMPLVLVRMVCLRAVPRCLARHRGPAALLLQAKRVRAGRRCCVGM